jgi:uncharacterized protein Usg
MAKKVLAIISLSILIFCLGSIAVHTIAVHTVKEMPDVLIPSKVPVDFAALYPFEEEAIKKDKTDVVASFHDWLEEKATYYIERGLPQRMKLVELARRIELALDWRDVADAAIILDLGEGYLSRILPKIEVQSFAANVGSLKRFLDTQAIPLLYVQTPYKVAPEDEVLGQFLDFSNRNVDAFLQELVTQDVPYIDLREELKKEHIEHHQLFFKTDHHWKAEAALWATNKIARWLNKQLDFGIDTSLFDATKYTAHIYPKLFLGSIGRKVTLAQAQQEDFTLLIPSFDTQFCLYSNDTIGVLGNFDSLIGYSYLRAADCYSSNPYAAFLSDDGAFRSIVNQLASNGKKILIIKDSFANAFAPFLSLGVARVDMLDLRLFHGSVETYILHNQPDVVLVLYNPSSISDEYEMWNFN